MSTYIKNTKQFEEEIRCCRELKIERHRCGITYTHHVFVGKVDGEGCDLYHYAPAIKPFFKAKFPAKIKKVRLTFKEHDTCQETLNIFDFDKDDVCIAERDDYPMDQKAEEKCIRKAESRLGEEMYSVINNNCDSSVNWIFSNDNTSLQSENCDVIKKSVGNAIDGIGSSGILRPVGHLTNGIFQQSNKSKQETSNLLDSDFEIENSLSEKTHETKVKRLAKEYETKMEQRHSGIFVKNVEKVYSQERKNKKPKIQTRKDKTNKTNDEHLDKKIDNTKPMNYDTTEKVPTHTMRKYTKDSNSHEPRREARGIQQQQQQDKFNGEEEDTRCTNVKDNAKEKRKKRNTSLSQRLESLEKEGKYAKAEQLRENSENAQHQKSSNCRDTKQAQRLENAKVHKLEAENARARELKDKIEAKTVQSEKLKDQSYKSHQQQTSNKTETKPSEKFQNKNEFVKEQTSGTQSYEANHINLWTDESVFTVGRGLVGASSICSDQIRNAIENNSDALKTILKQQFKKSGKKQISKCVCQKAKDEGMKKVSQTVSKAGVCFSVAVEAVSLTVNIINIATDGHMTSEQKNRSISREVVTSASGFAGTFIGQALIPIPVVGSLAGGVVGNAIGGMLGGGIFP